VWLARDEQSGLDVALKIVPREGKAAARAEREAEAAARLRHERCQRAYAFERDSSHVYIAYEYVPGRTLRQAMRAGELPDGDALEAAAQTLDALAHAHAHGIVHRDVKPANILLIEGGELAVKLLDFGLAHMANAESLTATGDVPGTLAYISPERLRGEQGGPAADVWAVGVLLWESLAGRHPFWGSSLSDTARLITAGAPPLAGERPDLPRHLLAIVDAALAVDPDRRPAARDLAEALRRPRRERKHPHSRDGGLQRRLRLVTSTERRVPPFAGRFGVAASAGIAAGWVAATLPFFPRGWPLGLAAAVTLLTALRPRLGTTVALAVPVLPLGNLAAGAAVAYAVAVAALVAAVSGARPALRRGLVTATLVIGGFVAAGVDAPVAGEADALRVVRTVGEALPLAAYGLAAVTALVATAFPFARGRWGAAALGAAVAAAAAAPEMPMVPLLVAAWLVSIPLWLADREH
jgi:hypothetical protein